MVATYAPRQPRQQNAGGIEWTQAQKDAYAAQWENGWRRKMAKVQPGQARDIKVKLIEITDLTPMTRTFQGVTTNYQGRTIWVQADEPGIDMLRFRCDTADNPFYFKTKLNSVLRACGIFPKEEEGLNVDFKSLYGTPLIMTIQKQSQRTDGKYGGFYTKIEGFKPRFEDDGEEEPTPPPAKAQAVARAPWEDDDED